MSPLRAEIYTPQEWVTAFEIKPGDRPGSLSDIKPGGKREIYILECEPDDSGSNILHSIGGRDREIGEMGQVREIIPDRGLEVVKHLNKGESFEMTIKTEKSSAPRKIRLSHY